MNNLELGGAIGAGFAILIAIIGFAFHLLKYKELEHKKGILLFVVIMVGGVCVSLYFSLSKINSIETEIINMKPTNNILVQRETNNKIASLEAEIQNIKTNGNGYMQKEINNRIENTESAIRSIKMATDTAVKEADEKINKIEAEIKNLRTYSDTMQKQNDKKIGSMEERLKTSSATQARKEGIGDEQPSECGPCKVEDLFIAYLSGVTSSPDGTTKATLTISNINAEPLFLAINQSSNPVLADADSGFSVNFRGSSGMKLINQNIPEARDENMYTRISPNQKLSVALLFNPIPSGFKFGRKIHLTIDFLWFNKGKMQTISASPCNSSAQ